MTTFENEYEKKILFCNKCNKKTLHYTLLKECVECNTIKE